MDSIKQKNFFSAFFLFALALFPLFACTAKPGIPEDLLDTPTHHASSGFKLIRKGYLYDAQREFKLALQLSPHYSPAYRGLGILYGMEQDFERAFKAMQRARDDAEGREDKALACVGFMRLYTMQKGKGWLEDVEANFFDALGSVKDLPEAYYYMGIAYEKAGRIKASKKALEKVLRINKRLVPDAFEALKRMKK